MAWEEIDTMMSGTVNKLSSQEDLNGYEDSGVETVQPILYDDEGLVDRENLLAPPKLDTTVTVVGGNNLVAASPAEILNHMMKGGNLGHGNVGGGSTNGGGNYAPSPNAESSPVQKQQAGSVQAVCSALKEAVA